MKTSYDERRECYYHKGEIAAICPACYDRALRQQMQQRAEEQKEEHIRYIARQAA